jgi:hypothetical protein
MSENNIGTIESAQLYISISALCLKVFFWVFYYRGLPLDDPWGYPKWVFSELYSYNDDHPETCKVTCTFDTRCCQYPCSLRMCPKHRLNEVRSRHSYRTHSQMKTLYDEMTFVGISSNALEDMARDYSVHPIEVLSPILRFLHVVIFLLFPRNSQTLLLHYAIYCIVFMRIIL